MLTTLTFLVLICHIMLLSDINAWQFWEKRLQMAKPNSDGIYEFALRIEHALTMTLNMVDKSTPIIDYSPDQLLWTQRNPDFHTKCSEADQITNGTNWWNDQPGQFDNVLASLLQWDGKHRKVITINGKSPGDPIVVPLGAKVMLHVQNRLLTQAITVHVHGITMQNRWRSDGVPYVQQCPIAPGSDYTYRFVADTAGTHWYHGHMMGDRAMGLLGGFVVIRPNERKQFLLENIEKPFKLGRQYFAILQDWSPENIEDAWFDQLHGRVKWFAHSIDSSSDCVQPENVGPSPDFDDPFFGYLRENTVLINEKGWHNQSDIRLRPSALPLTNFAIRRSENVLMRLTNGAARESYYVWVEEHDLWVVAADGSYIRPKKIDSLLIHPGERYDLLIRGQSRPKRRNFCIIFESYSEFWENIKAGETTKSYGLANLIYEDVELRRWRQDKIDQDLNAKVQKKEYNFNSELIGPTTNARNNLGA